MTALTQDLALSCLHNDPQNRTRRELIKRRQLGDIAGRSTPTSSKTAHFTPIPKGSSIQWAPYAVELVLVMPLRQLDWHREEYGQGVGESTGVVALSRTASTKERAASTDSERRPSGLAHTRTSGRTNGPADRQRALAEPRRASLAEQGRICHRPRGSLR